MQYSKQVLTIEIKKKKLSTVFIVIMQKVKLAQTI